MGLFQLNRDPVGFKAHLRDFLITLKEFQGDNQELYIEEREAELALKKKQEFEAALKIPGMVKPHDRYLLNLLTSRPDEGMMD